MDAGSLGAHAAAVAVPVVFTVLRRYFPAPPRSASQRSLEDLTAEYAKWEFATLPLMFAIAGAAAYLWWRLFAALAGEGGFLQDGASFSLRPVRIAWALPALLLGILSSGPAIEAILRRLLRNGRYAEYLAYQDLRHGFDSSAIAIPFYLGFGALAAVAVFLLSNWYVLFTPTEIRLNPALGVEERRFAYRDVVAIRTAPALIAPNGNSVIRREFVVRFADGSSWSTSADPSEATEAQVASLISTISERSGQPITELPVLTREEFE